MILTATFPTGVSNITVNGLHQWDYGQQLKIKAPDLPAMVEVHFACVGMDEAIVRSCSMVNGEGTVAIPDKCLEQTSPVYAWIYEINGTTGTTTKTILLNIIERTRPQIGEDIPIEIADKYTEAVTAMNEVVEEMESLVEQVSEGQLPMSYAAQAGHATTAGNATTADHAESAREADTAGRLGLEWVKINHGAAIDISGAGRLTLPAPLENGKTYLFKVQFPVGDYETYPFITFVLSVDNNSHRCDSSAWMGWSEMGVLPASVRIYRFLSYFPSLSATELAIIEQTLSDNGEEFHSDAVKVSYAVLC